MGEGFLKLVKSSITEELMAEPACFMLLTQIAYRARRMNNHSINGLMPGEALIGDYRKVGLTEQKYRTAKKKLEMWGLITTRATNRGTVAKLVGKQVFDINLEVSNEEKNERITTNKNKEKNTHTHVEELKFGWNRCVELKKEELEGLICKYGKNKVDKIIEELDGKLAEGVISSKNHFVTLQRFARYYREDKIVQINSKKKKQNEMPDVKSASFVKKTKEQLYGEI